MADLAVERGTVKKLSALQEPLYEAFLAANQKVYKGLMQSVDANKRAANPSAGGAALFVMGVVRKSVDATGKANDELSCELEQGGFQFNKHGTNTPTIADIGKICYASDNNTISTLVTDGPMAGIIADVTADYVEVQIGPAYHK